MHDPRNFINLIAIVTLFSLGSVLNTSAAGRKGKGEIPDFTQGGKTDGSHDWTLGPTGARGWIYAWKHTAEARQILITEVAIGSPADSVLEAGDVILGVDGKAFSDDARIQFARAVTRAEEEKSRGVLSLIRWRAGKTENVEITLPVMGTYSAMAPYDCQKSQKIFEQGCEAIAKRGLRKVSIPNNLNALALVASGKEDYHSMLAAYAREVAAFKADSFATWYYGYAILFLAEYVIATGDQSVMPGLTRLAMESAHGQSAVGTWGHRFALPNGRVGGYGCMNSPGLPLTVAMVLAREAGVQDPDLDAAIAKSAGFLRWYVNKGAIPYGDHTPYPAHEDNGKCSNAAVLFDLLGDSEAAGFFAKMGTAAYDERERGHTGNFFNILWAMPGVSRCGPLATATYWREQSWYYDLARGADGTFRYQGSPVGEEEHGKYSGFDNTGAYLLAYALPLKSLLITGKHPVSVPALSSTEVEDVIAAGRGYFSTKENDRHRYELRSSEDLFAGLSSWSPAVRKRSAQELGKRNDGILPDLLQLREAPDAYSRYGAVEALGYFGGKPNVVTALIETLNADDLWLRILSAEALAKIGKPARSAVPRLLERLAMTDLKNDPRGMEQRYLSFTLFNRWGGLIGQSLEGVDRALLVEAVRAGLQNEDGRARGTIASVYQNLTFDELKPLLPAIHEAIIEPAPSGIMFASEIRVSGLEIFAKHRIQEGLPLCIEVMEIQNWGKSKRIQRSLGAVEKYGNAAKAILPELRQLERDLASHQEARMLQNHIETLQKLITKIESGSGKEIELRRISE